MIRFLTAFAAACVVALYVIDAHPVGIIIGTIGVLVAVVNLLFFGDNGRHWWQPTHCTDESLVCVWCGDKLPEDWKSQRCRVGVRERLRWLRKELANDE